MNSLDQQIFDSIYDTREKKIAFFADKVITGITLVSASWAAYKGNYERATYLAIIGGTAKITSVVSHQNALMHSLRKEDLINRLRHYIVQQDLGENGFGDEDD